MQMVNDERESKRRIFFFLHLAYKLVNQELSPSTAVKSS